MNVGIRNYPEALIDQTEIEAQEQIHPQQLHRQLKRHQTLKHQYNKFESKVLDFFNIGSIEARPLVGKAKLL
jgi:hypothetical protein